MRPLRICFVAPTIYPVLSGDPSIRFVGGAEVQQTFLSRELAKRGHAVSVVCMDHGQPDGIMIDGVTVYRTHTPSGGMPIVRFIHPRFTAVWRAMARANADIYYQRSCAVSTGFVSAFARLHDRVNVFAAAHDMDFDPKLPLLRHGRDKVIYRWGVRNASAVVVQTQRQLSECRSEFGIDASCINSCYGHEGVPARQDGPILWVASVKPMKRPETFVELARRCPEYSFKMIGGGSADDMKALHESSKGVQNLEIIGFVPFAQVEAYFDDGAILVNTSDSEGFPNTFMQAWSRGMPSLSFFDAGARQDGRAVGLVAGSLDEMTSQIRALKTDAALWHTNSMDCKRYLLEHHSIGRAMNDYEALFDRLLRSKADR